MTPETKTPVRPRSLTTGELARVTGGTTLTENPLRHPPLPVVRPPKTWPPHGPIPC
jgi:hypothetical protein